MYTSVLKALKQLRFSELVGGARGERQHRICRDEPPYKKKLIFESLEPRVLLSADLMPAATVADAFAERSVRVDDVTVVVHGFQLMDGDGEGNSLNGLGACRTSRLILDNSAHQKNSSHP